MSEQFTILTVCTGNICRSPAVERLLAARLDPTVDVVSAGLRAVTGASISEPMVPLIDLAGASSHDFAAQQVSTRLVDGADLILPLTRAHRAAIVEEVPSAVRRTVTLTEFAHLVSLVPTGSLAEGTNAQRLRALVPLASAQRAHRTIVDEELDVTDPYRQSDAVYSAVFQQIEQAVSTIAQVLNTPSVPRVSWSPLTGA